VNYFQDLESHLIRERNDELLRELSTLRLEKRLRMDRRPSALQLVAFLKSTLLVLRRVGFAGR